MTAAILPFARSHDIERYQSVAADEAVLVAHSESQRLAIVQRHAPALFGLRSELNRVDDALSDRADTYARLLARSGDICETRWAPPFAPWLYWVVMMAMLLLEIPVNAAAIDLLRLPEAESYMLAAFFALANMVAAKYTARTIRQWTPDAMPVRSVAVAAVANIALLFGLLALADMRAEAADGAGSPLTFLVLQLMFYTIALLAAFWQTAPCADTELDGRQLQRAERAFRLCWQQRSRLAIKHNVVLAQIQAQMRREEHACARRVAMLRARRWAEDAADPLLEPITQANFQPIDLGEPVDHHPVSIEDVVPVRRIR